MLDDNGANPEPPCVSIPPHAYPEVSVRSLLLLPLLFAFACSDPFAEAQKTDTIEAYETFLAANPNSNYRLQGEIRVEELYLEKARTEATLEAYDVYMSKFPEGKLVEKAVEERREFLFNWADREDTPDSWNKYLTEYPTGDKKKSQEARKRLRMAESRDQIGLGPVEMEQVNLAENPDGPLDGWGFYTEVTNKGDKPIEYLNIRIRYLDGDGKELDHRDWPAVSPTAPQGLPQRDEFYQPIKPGESRTWEWTTGDMPAGWSKKATVSPIDIRWVGETEK